MCTPPVSFSPPRKLLLKLCPRPKRTQSWPWVPRDKTHARESQSTDQMPRWVLSVLLAGSGATAAAKMPPKPAAHRPAFILSQEKPEQPPKLALAALNVGRLRGGDSPDTDRVGTACTLIARPARLLLITAVFYLLRDASRRFTPQYATHWTAPAYAIMQLLIVVEWFFVSLRG